MSSGSPMGSCGACGDRRAHAAACPGYGVLSTSVKERVTTSPRDIPCGEDPIELRWTKTRWRCQEDYCERKSFTEAIDEVPARVCTTGRLRTAIGIRMQGSQGHSYYQRLIAAGKSEAAARRCLKRRIPRIVYQALLIDHQNRSQHTQPAPA